MDFDCSKQSKTKRAIFVETKFKASVDATALVAFQSLVAFLIYLIAVLIYLVAILIYFKDSLNNTGKNLTYY